MIVIVVERATPALRGQLTRWMLEVRAGVFVGTMSVRVRDKLWALVKARNHAGGSLLIARAPNEQGFWVESHGDTTRQVFENEGLWLIRKPLTPTSNQKSQSEAQPRRARPSITELTHRLLFVC
ncbi:MAG: type I-E CRISPR-associated endoribonuclease Cas2 [Polyangiaceae bacterium]|nr:type I-E CRISPR-associated endoribonuclease Cas2 [Polyangiaceae bacterium]